MYVIYLQIAKVHLIPHVCGTFLICGQLIFITYKFIVNSVRIVLEL